MKASQACIDLIKGFEGFRPSVYLCPAGKETIGYGHVILSGEHDLLASKITEAEAETILRRDVGKAEYAVSRDTEGVDLTQGQFDALVSFAFNVGLHAFAESTLLDKLKAGDTAGAAREFLRWNHIGKNVSPGLTRRREAEKALFESCKE